jgi:hypothetical protein
MNIRLGTYFALGLQCSFPVVASLDFAYLNGDMQRIWSLLGAKLGVTVGRMLLGEKARYNWGRATLLIIFGEREFNVQLGALNWIFRFGDVNIMEKIDGVIDVINRFKSGDKEM